MKQADEYFSEDVSVYLEFVLMYVMSCFDVRRFDVRQYIYTSVKAHYKFTASCQEVPSESSNHVNGLASRSKPL